MVAFTYTPSYSAAAQRAPMVRKSKFGDGYEQRRSDGLNPLPEIWDLQFTNREKTEGDAIDDFLAVRLGVDSFEWTTPKGDTANFKCESWTYTLDRGNNVTITARFEQVFDPA